MKIIFLIIFSISVLFADETSEGSVKFKTEDTVIVQVQENKLVFNWLQEQKSALVRVGKKWWVIFDKLAKNFELPKDRDLPEGLTDLKVVFDLATTDDITIFEIGIHDSFDISYTKEKNNAWSIELVDSAQKNTFIYKKEKKIKEKKVRKKKSYKPFKVSTKGWPTLEFLSLTKHLLVNVEDERSSKFYTFILTSESDQGVQKIYETPYYMANISIQGAVIERYSDQLYSEDSDYSAKLYMTSAPKAIDPDFTFEEKPIPLNNQVAIFKNFFKKDLENALENLKDEAKQGCIEPFDNFTRSWIELMVGDPIRAMTFLELGLQYYFGMTHHPFIRAMRATINITNRSFFSVKSDILFLPQTLEVKILKGISECFSGIPREQAQNLKKIVPFYKNHGAVIKDDFLLQVMIACILANDYSTIMELSNMVSKNSNHNFPILFKYVAAKSGIKKGLFTATELKNALDQPSEFPLDQQLLGYILFDIALTNITSRENLSIEESIRLLRRAQYTYRGGYFEFFVMKEVGNFYLKNKKYFETLVEYNQIKKYFPEYFRALHIDKKMEIAFNSFFMDNSYKKHSPLRVISVFDDYKEYSPDTIDGSKIIKIIGDLLIDLDLLDQAAELLSKESKRETDAPVLADIFLKIAQIHINNHDGEAALSVLKKIPQSRIESLDNQITNLTARAYDELDELDKAMQILDDKNTTETANQAVEILLSRKKWKEAKEKVFKLILKLEEEKNDDAKMSNLIRLAMINVLTGDVEDNEALRVMNSDFVKKQSDDIQKTFNYLTDATDISVITRPIIQDVLESNSSFLYLYKKFSAINK